MKNNCKIIISAIAGIMVGSLSVVGANQAIQAIQNTEVKIQLNGMVQDFVDVSTGEKQYPITYHDRTYLPLRNVAQLAGLDVDYDAETNTAILDGSNSSSFDDKTGLNFGNYQIENWHQVHGANIYGFYNGNTVFIASVPLGDTDYMKEEFNEEFKYTERTTDIGLINGIATLYEINEEDLENSPSVESVIIRFNDGSYGELRNGAINKVNASTIKEKVNKYNSLKVKYGY